MFHPLPRPARSRPFRLSWHLPTRRMCRLFAFASLFLQEQGWVYPPRVQLLLAFSIDPEEDSRYVFFCSIFSAGGCEVLMHQAPKNAAFFPRVFF